MKQSIYMSRRTDADALATKLVELVKARAKTKFNCETPVEVYPFATGYLQSVLGQIAAQSPASLRELQSALKFLESQ